MLQLECDERPRLPSTIVDSESLTEELRLATYAVVNSFLTQQQILADYLNMRSPQATVFLTVANATTQKYARRPLPDPKYRGSAALPPEAVGSISRRAIASATGLPRETVRRIVIELLASGHLKEVGPTSVASHAGDFVPETTRKSMQMLASEVSRLVNELSRLGVIVPRYAAPSGRANPYVPAMAQ